MREVDVIIVGQGLAGTALAWCLHWAGKSLFVCDRQEQGSASRVAAGLITPITGRRLVKADWFDDAWPVAVDFYRRVEQATHSTFFHPQPSLRLLRSAEEASQFRQRLQRGEFSGLTRSPDPPLGDGFRAPYGAFEMLAGGRIDVPAYLEASCQWLKHRGEFAAGEIDVAEDVDFVEGRVHVRGLQVLSRHLVFCQGIDARANPWFGEVRFDPAKGEVLDVDILGLNEARTVHGGVWLARGSRGYRCGATYDWETLDAVPTRAGREVLLKGLSELVRRPVRVIGQQAAVRPTMRDFRPAIGFHPAHRQVGCFNGLGSKGALLAPWLARQFVEALCGEGPIDPAFDVRRFP